jgi:hypothetical protein
MIRDEVSPESSGQFPFGLARTFWGKLLWSPNVEQNSKML